MIKEILDRALEIYTQKKERRGGISKEEFDSAKQELERITAKPKDSVIDFVTRATPFLRNSRLVAEIKDDDKISEIISDDYPFIWNEHILKKMVVCPKELQNCGKQIIYIAPHKSTFDSLLIGGALYQNNYTFPIFAAGENLFEKKFSEFLLSSLNAFKLKRDQKEWTTDYFRLVNSYMQANIENKTPFMFFPEGTRSRDGKFKPFKRGLVKLALDSYLSSEKDLEDLLFIPIGTAYTSVFEDSKFSKNKKGSASKLTLIGDLVNILKNQGDKYIKFGNPISLNGFVKENGLEGKNSSLISKKILPYLRNEVISTCPVLYTDFLYWEMNELFKGHGGEIVRKNLEKYVDQMVEHVNSGGNIRVIPNETLEESLDRMKKRGFIKKNNGIITLLNPSVMEFYSNKLTSSYLE